MLRFELDKMSSAELDSVLNRSGVDLSDAMESAADIIAQVRKEGDPALMELARRLDGFDGSSLVVEPSIIKSARTRLPTILVRALRTAKRRIESYHSRQRIEPFEFSDELGIYGQRVVPLRRVGIYVPGGTASYASSVLMACVPARIAGVEEIAICTPGRLGKVPDSILAAADMCGVREVYSVGGAQAIAAMAYGTATVRRVQKIVGPGGSFVTAAKLLVRTDCEIDFLAGPSEVLIIADNAADARMAAADMLAQLEHDPLARAVLVSDSRRIIDSAMCELEAQLKATQRRDIASSASERGAIFIVAPDMDRAVRFANDYAPEHLLIDVKRPARILARIENAGSVFIGRSSSVAFGDYCAGTNHILPTRGVARMKSALSVYDFVKIVPYQELSKRGAKELVTVVEPLALSEGLPAHAAAARMRAEKVRR